MADGLNERRRVVRASDEHVADSLPRGARVPRERSVRPVTSPHSHKFLAATAMLIGVAVGAIAIAIALLVHGSSRGTTQVWSQWKPADQGIAGEREIAAEVSPFYRATPASQLVVVTVQNIANSSSSASATAGSTSSSSGQLQLALRDPTSGSLQSVSGTSAVYNLCGLGPSCAIETGTPSAARLLLLRREALELALYTLKYISGVQNVVAILPPGRTTTTAKLSSKPPQPGKTATSSPMDLAVVFQRTGLQRYLDRPLAQTLPEDLPPAVGQMTSAPEAELVSVLTGEALFRQQLIQAQDGSNVLVLSPTPPQ
jgi:hypothetical protein